MNFNDDNISEERYKITNRTAGNHHTNPNPQGLTHPFVHQFANMSTEAKTKKFGSGERSIPHHSEKAPKYYPAEDIAQPKKVRAGISRARWRKPGQAVAAGGQCNMRSPTHTRKNSILCGIILGMDGMHR